MIASAQEVVQLERKELKIQLTRDRQIVDDLIDEFNREGSLHKSLQFHAARGPLPKQVPTQSARELETGLRGIEREGRRGDKRERQE